MIKQHDLTTGDITRGIWSFAVPLMFGNVMQQLYNLVDTWVVGTYLGNHALAAVGFSYTLMTSCCLWRCWGAGSGELPLRPQLPRRYQELEC